MASSDKQPAAVAAKEDAPQPPGKPMTMMQAVIDRGAQMVQSLKPMKGMSQHVCTFALYAHDLTRQMETHHYISRLNQDFLQSAVYDSDDSNGRLIEYIVSDRIFEALSAEEQRLWHSHAHEVKSGLWVNPRIPDSIARPELDDMAKTYGKFWCTWQLDRGDKLPVGAPALMMSPQAESPGKVKAELVGRRDERYKISTAEIAEGRMDVEEAEVEDSEADYWRKHPGKGLAIDIS
ncbi:oil body-associated protein 2A-like isoform X2 [Momordica charantia]|uniref:Oil body-associated protein 2A-like isoform X2 n=1 Tax=Momordica charantia TaxID=3673 RepID=A0A6J1CEU0_MOMCH|nr:oil body-associated protein 2A-like isoform X2 [Momordica charantia]